MISYSKSMCRLLCLLVATTLFSACTLQRAELPFGTIEQAKIPSIKEGYPRDRVEMYKEEESKMFIVASPDDISSLSSFIPPQTQPEFSNTDFGTHFVIAVFQGLKRSYDYGVNIERIVHSGDTIKVYASFEEPGNLVHLMVSSPYHVVRVEKPPEHAGEEVRFIMVANGKKIAKEIHRFP